MVLYRSQNNYQYYFWGVSYIHSITWQLWVRLLFRFMVSDVGLMGIRASGHEGLPVAEKTYLLT